MTPEQAKARLVGMVAASTTPELSTTGDGNEIDQLLAIGAREDADGLSPHDDDWTPTYDLNAAAAEGWRWKAGKVTGRFDIGIDGQQLSRAQVYDHCLTMAERYAARVVGVLSRAPDLEEWDVIGN